MNIKERFDEIIKNGGAAVNSSAKSFSEGAKELMERSENIVEDREGPIPGAVDSSEAPVVRGGHRGGPSGGTNPSEASSPSPGSEVAVRSSKDGAEAERQRRRYPEAVASPEEAEEITWWCGEGFLIVERIRGEDEE